MKTLGTLEPPFFIHIKQRSSKSGSCEKCQERQGLMQILTAKDLDNIELPPYHRKCRCEVVFIKDNGPFYGAYGTKQAMIEVCSDSSDVFYAFTRNFNSFGGIRIEENKWGGPGLIAHWWKSYICRESAPEIACQERAGLLVERLENRNPASSWHHFRLVTGYIPNVGWNVTHSWAELNIQYVDKSWVIHKETIKYDPYYKTIQIIAAKQ